MADEIIDEAGAPNPAIAGPGDVESTVKTEGKPKVSWGEVVQVGGKQFEVDPSLAEALRAAEREQQKQRDAEIQGFQRKADETVQAELAKLRGDDGNPGDTFDADAFWQNPQDVLASMINKAVESMEAKLTGQYTSERNLEKAMAKFYTDHPELQNYEDLVEWMATKHSNQLRGIMDQQERMDALANLTSKLVMQMRGGKSEGQGPVVESGGSVVTAGTAPPVAKEEQNDTEVPASLTAALKMPRSKRAGIAKSLGL